LLLIFTEEDPVWLKRLPFLIKIYVNLLITSVAR